MVGRHAGAAFFAARNSFGFQTCERRAPAALLEAVEISAGRRRVSLFLPAAGINRENEKRQNRRTGSKKLQRRREREGWNEKRRNERALGGRLREQSGRLAGDSRQMAGSVTNSP
jgi:hypothetical protein